MSLAHRLARLEQAPPEIAVRRWLAGAHAFGSSAAYAVWLAGQPASAFPRLRVRAQAEAAARGGLRPDSIAAREAVSQAGSDAIFLIELVAALNARIEELVEPGYLRVEGLMAGLRLVGLEARTGVSPDPGSVRTCAGRWISWCNELLQLALILQTAEAARLTLESEYLGGATTLFPDLAASWGTLLAELEALIAAARTGSFLPDAERAGVWPPHPRGVRMLELATPEARAPRVLQLAVVDLVDAASAAALRSLGDWSAAQSFEARRKERWTRLLAIVEAADAPPASDQPSNGRRGRRGDGGARDKRCWRRSPQLRPPSLTSGEVRADGGEGGSRAGPRQHARPSGFRERAQGRIQAGRAR